MSQAENKVSWCVKKAQKELAKGKKHRGLVKTVSDIEEAKKHIAKAEHNLKAALNFEKNFPDWSVSALFYVIYHCFLAIIAKYCYESRNQECTIALIEYLTEQKTIDISSELITALKTTDVEETQQRTMIAMRENFQYGTETSVKELRLEELKKLSRQAIEEAKNIIYT